MNDAEWNAKVEAHWAAFMTRHTPLVPYDRRTVSNLVHAHNEAAAAFAAIVRTARAAIAALDFPLGSPSGSYGLEDIDACFDEWLTPREDRDIEDAARDMVTA